MSFGTAPTPALGRSATRSRDRYIDFLRTASLLVVVVWHWGFTVVDWRADGPHAGNPINSIHGFWALTWLFQVMPVFFLVGGFSHLMTWASVKRSGGGYRQFVARRLKRLVMPALITLAVVGLIALAAPAIAPGAAWVGQALKLLVSPMWFLALYLMLVLLTPVALALHDRGGEIVPVVMAGVAAMVDIARFRYHWVGVELINLALIWGLAHQLGFFWPRLVAASRRFAWCLTIGGFFALLGLTNMGLYPRSMVGVPGQDISNMAPPTLCIVALTIFQLGVVLLLRERALVWMQRPGPSRVMGWAAPRAMTVYLWHTFGFALAYGTVLLLGFTVPESTSLAWWVQRPVWLLLPMVFTVPLVHLFGRFEKRSTRTPDPDRRRPGLGVAAG